MAEFTFDAPEERQPDSHESQLHNAIKNAGLEPPDQLFFDGKIHRFNSGSKGKSGAGDKTGWYVMYNDGVPAGKFGDWRSGIECNFRANIGRKYSAAEEMAHTKRMIDAKNARDAAREQSQAVAADTVELIWDTCTPASSDHPYLKRKGIKPNGARVTGDGRLVVPLFDADGCLSSLQYISSDGSKMYHSGAATGGCFNQLGDIFESKIYLAEGFATASTIHETTGSACIAAYSAGNLVRVTEIVKTLYSDCQVIIVADNDASGVGKNYADQASAKYGARVIMPPDLGDANDYLLAGGDLLGLLTGGNVGDGGVIKRLGVLFGDELSSEFEAPDELIEGLMTIGSLTVLYGDSNSGKTFFALSLATAIAEGSEVYGRKVDAGLVIYLATEAPASIRTRMQAIKKYLGVTLSNLCIVQIPINFYENDNHAQDVIELVREIEVSKGQKVKLIIGDTLARMSAGANENSGEDMAPVMARFDRVAAASGAALLIVHHNGKDSAKGARGWSGIRAHIDTEIEVTEVGGIRKASVTKQRELSGKGDDIYFKLSVVEMGKGKFGGAATTCIAVQDVDAQQEKPLKKESKCDGFIKLFERIWFATGAELRDGSPFIYRNSAQEFLKNNDEMADRTIENWLKPSHNGGFINTLMQSLVIEKVGFGWIISNNVVASVMLIKRNVL